MNILVVKPSSLGDIIHTFPAVALIRRRYPEAGIYWVASQAFVGIITLFPAVNGVIVFRRERLGQLRNCPEALTFLRELRQRPYDIAVDFQGLLRSGLITRVSGARRRIGFREAREGARLFYSEKVAVPPTVKHAVDRNVFLVRSALGITEPMSIPDLVSPREAVEAARELWGRQPFAANGPVLAVAPAARWPSKTWPPAFFAEVISRVAREIEGVRCWLLGTHDERVVADAVAGACSGLKPVNLAGETALATLVELLRGSGVLLTNDSGPMHLAAALRVPTVALVGPTDPELTGPYGDRHAVFRGQCPHSPCRHRRCPLPDRACIANVAAADVAAAVVQFLRQPAGPDAAGSGAG